MHNFRRSKPIKVAEQNTEALVTFSPRGEPTPDTFVYNVLGVQDPQEIHQQKMMQDELVKGGANSLGWANSLGRPMGI